MSQVAINFLMFVHSLKSSPDLFFLESEIFLLMARFKIKPAMLKASLVDNQALKTHFQMISH